MDHAIQHGLHMLRNPMFEKAAITVFVGYLALVRMLRFKRYREVHEKYQKKFEDGSLTPEDAQEVMRVSNGYDIPFLLNYSLAFALFKTYAIPSISGLLAATKELKSQETISKRYADTELLVATWVGCPISGYDKFGEFDPRAMIALARVNYLHSKYHISNGDYLYTLILFVLEPIDWAKKYGWREMSPLEQYAYCIFWREIGKHMDIRDIPETLEEMRAWARQYEEEHMKPAKVNKELAEYTTEELIYTAPKALGFREWVASLTVCLLDEPVRIAMMQPEQPMYKHLLVLTMLRTISLFQKWFMLPRADKNYRFPTKWEMTRNADGYISPVMHPNKFPVRPWYKPESKTIIGKIWDRVAVLIRWHSHIPGPSFHSEGYRLEEMGPLHLEKTGNDEVLRKAGEMLGCPITGPFARP